MAGFDPYKVLQVDPEADLDVIQAAYRRLASRYHPDHADAPDAAARMVLLNQAWEIVSDPGRRAELDAARVADAARRAESRLPVDPERAARPGPTHDGPSEGGDGTFASFTDGRSTTGGGYDPGTMRASDALGAAGPPPGNPSGPVLSFGRYAGWSLGEIGRRDVAYLEWLERMPIGRPYRDAIDGILRSAGRRRSASDEARERRGLFRRR
ncbi:MAG TPA: DnaJ domain-containing protein [Candidatus Limnocylindrales bacterium]|nr:DnaJ domain-containing protein [Candidatus Limnocylindrales bacterium]